MKIRARGTRDAGGIVTSVSRGGRHEGTEARGHGGERASEAKTAGTKARRHGGTKGSERASKRASERGEGGRPMPGAACVGEGAAFGMRDSAFVPNPRARPRLWGRRCRRKGRSPFLWHVRRKTSVDYDTNPNGVNEMALSGIPVAFKARAIIHWSDDVARDNRLLLSGVDPDYFITIMNAVGRLEGERASQHAAVQIRLMRDQAAEMLFAMFGAALQSPHGAAMWLTAYQAKELDHVVECLARNQPMLTYRGERAMDWSVAVAEVFRNCDKAEDARLRDYVSHLPRFLARLSQEFLDPVVRKEYAAIKHGLRIHPGPVSVTMTRSSMNQEHPEDTKPVVMEGCGYGAGFFVQQKVQSELQPEREERHHQTLVLHLRSWTPDSLALQTEIMVTIIKNVRDYLLAVNGTTASASQRIERWVCNDPTVFHTCWRATGPMIRWPYSNVTREMLEPAPSESDAIQRLKDARVTSDAADSTDPDKR